MILCHVKTRENILESDLVIYAHDKLWYMSCFQLTFVFGFRRSLDP